MATSKVSIANGALQRLGAKRIESLTQDHPNARSMSAAFDKTMKAETRRFDWSFAIKRESIAADAAGPTWGDWNRFSQPNDFIRLIRDDESGYQVDFKVEGIFILSKNAAPLEIRYIALIEDPNFYDSLFVEALECKLAAVCCKEVTGSNDLKDRMVADYGDAIAEAKKLGSIEKAAQEFPEDEWLIARL